MTYVFKKPVGPAFMDLAHKSINASSAQNDYGSLAMQEPIIAAFMDSFRAVSGSHISCSRYEKNNSYITALREFAPRSTNHLSSAAYAGFIECPGRNDWLVLGAAFAKIPGDDFHSLEQILGTQDILCGNVARIYATQEPEEALVVHAHMSASSLVDDKVDEFLKNLYILADERDLFFVDETHQAKKELSIAPLYSF